MASVEPFPASNDYGLLGENLSREVLLSRGEGLLTDPNREWPIVIPADDEVWRIGQRLANQYDPTPRLRSFFEKVEFG